LGDATEARNQEDTMPRNASTEVGGRRASYGWFAIWVATLALLPAGAAAQVEQRVRIQGTWSNPTDEFRERDVDGDFVIEAEDELGWRLGYEVLFRDHWGAELAASTTRHDIEGSGGFAPSLEFARIRITPITASLLYHFNPRGKADFFLGGGAAYVDYGDFELTFAGLDPDDDNSFSVEPDLTYTLQAGLDVKLTDRWAVTGNVQWIDTDAEFDDEDGGDSLPISPVIVGAGVALRF
jgi:outer membrane protein W